MTLPLGPRRAPVAWGLPHLVPRPVALPQPPAASKVPTLLPVVLVSEFSVGLFVALLR